MSKFIKKFKEIEEAFSGPTKEAIIKKYGYDIKELEKIADEFMKAKYNFLHFITENYDIFENLIEKHPDNTINSIEDLPSFEMELDEIILYFKYLHYRK